MKNEIENSMIFPLLFCKRIIRLNQKYLIFFLVIVISGLYLDLEVEQVNAAPMIKVF